MVKALKNPHYKKIWEYVNWKGRHPQAKSVEEALFLETYNTDCNVLHCGLNFIVSMQSLCLLRNSGLQLGDKQYHAFKQSFGRPIMLEAIMLLLPTNSTHFIKNVDGSLQIKIFGIDEVGCDFYIGTFDWQLTKPLHEQSSETWETISKFTN